jgi:hypothetical protein
VPGLRAPPEGRQILDNARYGVKPAQGELTYTVPEAKRSFWTGLFPAEGRVAACMCDGCGRILLYGAPREAEGTWPSPTDAGEPAMGCPAKPSAAAERGGIMLFGIQGLICRRGR